MHDSSRILVVDDNITSLRLMESFLSLTGYQAVFLDDSRLVLETLRREHHNPFDLVLMDISMPGISGIDVCRLMQHDPHLSVIPVIFLTAQLDEDTMSEAFEVGGCDFLTKPFVFTELQSRIETQLRLRRSERHLRRQLGQRELMLTTLAHDLRGPIGSSAVVLKRLLQSDKPLEERRNMLSSLADSLHRTYELLEDMLSWSQAVTDELPFHPHEQDLTRLYDDCLALHRDKASQKQIQLNIDVPPKTTVAVDDKLVRTVLNNLVSNALKFTPAEGKITLGFKRYDKQIELSVCDTGQGLSPELLNHIALNHPIVSQPGTQGEKGTGMGLKLCQEFARRHGGELKISSTVGEGSCFSLLLPQKTES